MLRADREKKTTTKTILSVATADSINMVKDKKEKNE